MRKIAAIAIALTGYGTEPLVNAQTPAAIRTSAEFEVSSVKPSQPGGRGVGGVHPTSGGERYVASNVSLKYLITVAYRVKLDHIVEGSGWIENDRWDLNAKAERPASVEEHRIMLQKLLGERFKLRFHRDSKELPVFALTVDGAGSKMKSSNSQGNADPSIDQSWGPSSYHVVMKAQSVSMGYLAWRLGSFVDRPVIDRTKLLGAYDFDLKFREELSPELMERALITGRPDISGPLIFEALQKQLGLRLQPAKGPVEIIVIDHAEKPGEN